MANDDPKSVYELLNHEQKRIVAGFPEQPTARIEVWRRLGLDRGKRGGSDAMYKLRTQHKCWDFTPETWLTRKTDANRGMVCLTPLGIDVKQLAEGFESFEELLNRSAPKPKINPHTSIQAISSPRDTDDVSVKALADDLERIDDSEVQETEREAVARQRVVQGEFRRRVLAKWSNRCCVTGSTTTAAIRASHIQPWRDCDNKERLDPHNGLPLIATLDALFDAHLISFDDKGNLLVSTQLSSDERTRLGLDRCKKLSQKPTVKTETYLEVHRKEFHRKQSSNK